MLKRQWLPKQTCRHGPQDERGIDMEVETAAADLAAGSDAVILRHPESVKTISKLIKALA